MNKQNIPPLVFEIPVPWSDKPIRVTASTTVAAMIVVAIATLLWFSYLGN